MYSKSKVDIVVDKKKEDPRSAQKAMAKAWTRTSKLKTTHQSLR